MDVSDSDDFCSVYPRVYLAFHRRDGRRSELTNASRAVLTHLIGSGPITIGEAALHLDRAQSVVSEIVNQLQGHGLVAREPDPADRRRTLVWLTDTGATNGTRAASPSPSGGTVIERWLRPGERVAVRAGGIIHLGDRELRVTRSNHPGA